MKLIQGFAERASLMKRCAYVMLRMLVAVLVLTVAGGLVEPLPGLPSGPGVAQAQNSAIVARARSKFQEGSQAFDAKNYKDAIKHFKEAYTIKPKALLLLYIAQSYSHTGDVGQLLDYLVRYSSTSPQAAAEVREDIEKTRAALKVSLLKSASSYVAEAIDIANPKVGSSEVSKPVKVTSTGPVFVDVPFGVATEPRGAKIFIDDKEWGARGETPSTLRLFPGKHKVWVEKDFFAPQEAEINVKAVTSTSKPQNIAFKLKRQSIPVEIRTEPATAQIIYVGETGERRELGLGMFKGELPAGPAKFVLTITGEKSKTVDETVRASQVDETGAMQLRFNLKDADSLQGDRFKMAQLTIKSYLQNATIYVDGKDVGLTPGDIVAKVAPGYHRLEARLPGFESWTEEVSLNPGESLEIQTPDVLKIAESGTSWGGWIFTGVAAAAVGAGGFFTFQGLDKQSQADDATDAATKSSLQGEADDSNLVGYALYGVGGAALLTGVLFFALNGSDGGAAASLSDDEGVRSPYQINVGLSPTPGGVGLGVRVDVP